MKLDPKQLEYNYEKDDFSGYLRIPDGVYAEMQTAQTAAIATNQSRYSYYDETEADEAARSKKQRAAEGDIGIGE